VKESRRSFIKMLITGSTLAVGSMLTLKSLSIFNKTKASPEDKETTSQGIHPGDKFSYPNPNDPNKAWGMVIDLNKCKGCGGSDDPPCMVACRRMHNVPADQHWIKIYYIKDNPFTEGYFFPRVCMQCENPPCRNICPVTAALRRDDGDGLVLIDHDRCIGCRLCIAACPYEVRHFNWEDQIFSEENTEKYGWDPDLVQYDSPMYVTRHQRGTTDKCDFCGHLAYQGILPACVEGCSEGALYYGNLKENSVTNNDGETLDVQKTVSDKGGYRYKEELGAKPRVYYIPRRY
jgi:molybdopterin-containing oxidoreductase family iron-sulfur binding subunit